MSNSTTPSDKHSKKNGKAERANKDKKSSFGQGSVADTDKSTTAENVTSVSSPVEKPTASGNALNTIINDDSEQVKPTDKFVEVAPVKPELTDKFTEVTPEEAKAAALKANAGAEAAKPTDKKVEMKSQETKHTEPKLDNTKSVDKKAELKPETKKTDATNRSEHPSPPEQAKSGSLGTTLSIIAIALVIGLGAGLYYHGHSQIKLQQDTIKTLQDKVAQLEPQIAGMAQSYTQLSNNHQNDQLISQQKQLQEQLKQQQQTIANVEKESALQLEQFKALQSKVSTLSTSDANLWLLAEADFLVKQAVRKLNTEKDITTAIALLTSADASIRDMNDPSLHDLRSAIAKDISTLASIKRVDIDGTMIKLYQLSDQLDNMALIRNQLEDDAVAQEDLEVSENIADWKSNLSKSWKGFIADFITITPIETKVSDTDKPELTANQGAYLRENIRLQLLIAAQAVPGYQQETYRQALAKAMSWVKEYYAQDNAANQAFIDELSQLQQQDIRVDIPNALSSQALLNKQVEGRLRSLLSQNSQPEGAGK